MWEKDRQVLRAFKECFAAANESLRAGEDVDVASVCKDETEALVNYTSQAIGYYKGNTGQEVSEKKNRYYTPKMPYFQNL